MSLEARFGRKIRMAEAIPFLVGMRTRADFPGFVLLGRGPGTLSSDLYVEGQHAGRGKNDGLWPTGKMSSGLMTEKIAMFNTRHRLCPPGGGLEPFCGT